MTQKQQLIVIVNFQEHNIAPKTHYRSYPTVLMLKKHISSLEKSFYSHFYYRFTLKLNNDFPKTIFTQVNPNKCSCT